MDINDKLQYYKQKYGLIDGKWELEELLGSGAYGSVFKAVRRDAFGEQRSAIKIVTIPATQSEYSTFKQEHFELDEQSITSYFYGFVEEFAREFHFMEQLKGNSTIVSYEDHSVVKKTDEFGWDIFIRMELLTPLASYFSKNKPCEENVIKLAEDMCTALEICQKHHIIHRDIKPANIFISNEGNFKLGDFGVARTLEKTSSGLSQKGTYIYMAPEVFRGQTYNLTVDIYSLGIVMYRLLNNNFEPFRTDLGSSNAEEALKLRMQGTPIPPPANASKALSDVILKACAFDPRDRFADATEMKNALRAVVSGTAQTTVEPKLFCTSCGTPYPAGQHYCTVCKAPLSEAAKAEQSAKNAVNGTDDGTVRVNAAEAVPMTPVTPVMTPTTPVTPLQQPVMPVQQPIYAAPQNPVPQHISPAPQAHSAPASKAEKPKKKDGASAVLAWLFIFAGIALWIPALPDLVQWFLGGAIDSDTLVKCIMFVFPSIALLLGSIVLFAKRSVKRALPLVIVFMFVAVIAVVAINVFFDVVAEKGKESSKNKAELYGITEAYVEPDRV